MPMTPSRSGRLSPSAFGTTGDPLYDKRKNDPTQGMADTDMRKLAEQGRRELPESLMTMRERREHRKQREDATDVA